MQPDTRQTLIGVLGLTAVEITALLEGFNGKVATAYFLAILLLVAPEAVSNLEVSLF